MSKLSNRKYKFLPLGVILLTFFYNEYLIYWQTLSQCYWDHDTTNNVNLMLIADTHLLGSRNGHWFDKLRREWQQHRAFQTARSLLRPDYIVIMGDVTDEGKWCSDREWTYYENRVQELFYTDEKTKLILVVGNHDVGFHYDIIERKIERFNRTFKGQYLELLYSDKRNDISFITANSMTLENDRCKFCTEAQRQLKKMNKTLNCLKANKKECTLDGSVFKDKIYSRPVLFTHFPLFRSSDSVCPHDIDSDPNNNVKFKQNYDTLSKDSTKQILETLNPRLVFDGHTHFSCFNSLNGVPEYTIASFSWRNIKTPSMLLLQLDNENHWVKKCYLPSENNVYLIYGISGACVGLYYLIKYLRKLYRLLSSFKINKIS